MKTNKGAQKIPPEKNTGFRNILFLFGGGFRRMQQECAPLVPN